MKIIKYAIINIGQILNQYFRREGREKAKKIILAEMNSKKGMSFMNFNLIIISI